MAAATGPYHYVWKAGTNKDVDGILIHDCSLSAFMRAGYLINDPADDYGSIEDDNPTEYFIDIYGNVPPVPAGVLPNLAPPTSHEDLPPDPRVEPFADYGDLGPLG